MAAAAACSRGNLQLLLATREELLQLAEVQGLLDAAAAASQQPPPSVLRGLVIRLKYAGAYHLLPVEQLLVAADGKRGLAVQAPGLASAPQLRVPLSSTSGSSPLTGDQWEATGQAEAARFAEHLWQRGQSLALAETAAVAWRKQAALAWYAQHGAQPPAEQQQHLPALLQQLADAAGIAGMQQELEPEQRQEQEHDVVIGALLLAQPRQPPAVAGIAVPVPPRQAAAAAAAIPAVQAPAQHTVAPADTPAFTGPNGASTEGLAAITAAPASLAAQVEPLQAAAASLVPGAPAAPAAASGSGAATAAALAGIQRQLRELQQLAQQGQPQKAHAPPHSSWPQPEQLPGSPACSQLPGNGFDSHPPPAYGSSWGRPPADLQRLAGFQPAGSRWPEPPTPAVRPWADDGSSSGSASLVRLPGNPSLSSARNILAATLRRAVPCYERCFEAKRAALNGLLRLGLACSRSGERGAFEQALVALEDLAHELQQEGAEGAELYRGVDGVQQLRHLLRDVKEAFMVQLTWQHRRQHVLLRVDRLSAVFGRPEDLEAGCDRKRKAAEGHARGPPPGSPARPGPSAVLWDPAQLRHLAPVQLSGSGWRLTGAEIALGCTPMPRGPAAEDQLFGELEALCRGVGSTVVSSRLVPEKEKVYLTFPSPEQAAVAIEHLQTAQFPGRQAKVEPVHKSVGMWRSAFASEAAAADRAIAALKSGTLSSWPRSVGCAPDVPKTQRHVRRSRSRSRSRCCGGGCAQGLRLGLPSPGVLLAPAFVRRTNHAAWELTSPDIFISGLPPSSEDDQIRLLDELSEQAGATLVAARCRRGDLRGDMAYITLASASQAARMIEQFADTQVLGRRVYLRPLEKDVEALRRRYPELATDAAEALAAAKSIRQRRPDVAADANAVPLGRQPPPQQQQQGEKRRRRSLSPSRRKRSRSRSGGRGGSPGGPRRRRTAHPASNMSAQRASEYGTPSRSASPESAAKADQPSSGGVRGGSRTPPRSCSPTRSTAALHS